MKLKPIAGWSDFCEAQGTRCTYTTPKGRRCDNGAEKNGRCASHPLITAGPKRPMQWTKAELKGLDPPAAPKPEQFTRAELNAIGTAASRTWSQIAYDAGFVRSNAGAYELILDADRIVTLGKLDPALYTRLCALPIRKQNRLLKDLVGSLV